MLMSETAQSVEVSYQKFGIDFAEAAMRHMEWRERLKNHISGTAMDSWPSSEATQYDRCELGRWLRTIGRAQLGHLSAFRHLELAHAEFHYFAGVILSKAMLKEVVQAEEILKNEFSQATRRVLVSINEINALPSLQR
ncbi:MAG: CZB domain-containing protein [Gallionellaceae bacterium]|nr:CZB domain-containing protein [Gallionellaceae bacterium]